MSSQKILVIVAVLLSGSVVIGVVTVKQEHPLVGVGAGDCSGIETFVLTPIHEEVLSMTVPAELCGPITNNSCRNWTSHIEKCYLPGRRMDVEAGQPHPELACLLERQLSAELGAWKVGAWPSDGSSLDMPLEQYATCEHLWLSRRVEMRQSVGFCWLGAYVDLHNAMSKTATQPAASIRVEVFGGTRDAKGYPQKVAF